MTIQDKCCTLAPYFKVSNDNMAAFKNLCSQFVEKTKTEDGCLFYGFAFDGENVFVREGYKDADGVLAHLENVGPLLGEALKISEITRLEVHGPAEELEKLREPLAELNPQFFTIEYSFRN